ncbi:MAG TPA: tail fiber protein [bacterium]|nr:tail fiber protein [bacterium]
MSEPFVAEIRIVPFNFAPTGWAMCNGQLMPISQNTALFSLLGTTYGGDGKSTFALPDLQGRAPMQPEQGPGLSLRFLGESDGSQTVTLLTSEIPAHTHQLRASTSASDEEGVKNPTNAVTGQTQANQRIYGPAGNLSAMAMGSLAPAGGGLPHNNMQPYLALTFIIALQGIFPARS